MAHTGELGTSGSVSWMFDVTGRCVVNVVDGVDPEEVMDAAVRSCVRILLWILLTPFRVPHGLAIQIEAGADDVEVDESVVTVIVEDPKAVGGLRDALVAAGFPPASVAVERTPQVCACSGERSELLSHCWRDTLCLQSTVELEEAAEESFGAC